jgi:hypothetical protein
MRAASRWSRLLGWLLLRDALAKAREDDANVPPARKAALRSARAHVDAADSLLDSEDDLSAAPVLTLYREALLWLIADDEAAKRALAVAIDTSPESWQASLAPASESQNEAAREQLRRCASLQLRLPTESDSPGLLHDIEAMRAPLQALLVQAEEARWRDVRTVLRKRRWRIGFAAAVLSAVLTSATALVILLCLPRDLAQNKPWHTSSALPLIYTANVLFHTIEEQNPWFEIDLVRPTTIHRLHVRNRADCCSERAVPLVAEVSLDRSTWQQVARTDSPFADWDPSFPPARARYVRLRVPRFTTLHLEDVKVF